MGCIHLPILIHILMIHCQIKIETYQYPRKYLVQNLVIEPYRLVVALYHLYQPYGFVYILTLQVNLQSVS